MDRKKIKAHIKNSVFICLVYVEVILCTVLGGILCDTSYIDIFRNVATVIVGVMIFIYYYSLSGDKVTEKILPKILFFISFAVSNLLVAYTGRADIGTIWIVAVAILAVKEGIGHAISCHALLMLQYLVLSADAETNIRIIIFYAIIGILIALVLSEIRNNKEFIYASLILVALTMVMIIVLFSFDLKEVINNKDFVIRCLVGDGIILLVSWITYCINPEMAERNAQRGRKRNQKRDKKIILQLLESDNILLKRMKNYSETMYAHSIRVGRLSYKAAYYMGCDCLLAKAGGLYHEAARIYEHGQYLDECKMLITEYNFPTGLSDIIMQYASTEKPKSYEATIVMISDSIISTDEYLERTGKRSQISDEKLVKSIFNKRIKKGNFSESGMNNEQIEKLMDFYINNAFKEDL